MRSLDLLKRELDLCVDFSLNDAFKNVDRYTDGALNTHNIKQFFNSNGNYSSDRVIYGIIRRMDTAASCKISYSDFAEFMRAYGSADL